MTSKEVRRQFLDFFASKEHAIVESSPVIPLDDPTLTFVNAGMNQFKDVFLGTGSRAYKRVANTQKCIRAGGKHNDLDDVGQDTYHHTFFEMLGNWSFGDYFKEEAIRWAWELLTETWGIEKQRLHATFFEGDSSEGLEPDAEAARLWRSVTDIKAEHVHPGSKKDNFWEMGDTGPCGPCSEIHIDLTPDGSGGPLVNAGDPRVIELWNLVFIQFNRDAAGKLAPLPARHVDTGMGFERLCAILNGKASNYDTDVWAPIFDAIQKRTGAPAYTGTLPTDANPRRDREGACGDKPRRDREGACMDKPRRDREGACMDKPRRDREGACTRDQIMIDVSYRVIADHVRCLTFALTDGAMPSNEGRGYVLRRILRRAVRYGRQYFDLHKPFLCDLVEPVVEQMADVFPELRTAHGGKNIQHVTELIRDEEASFGKTLERGIKLFNEFATVTRAVGGDTEAQSYLSRHLPGWDHPREVELYRVAGTNVIPGAAVFRLYDTYGFPPDLTQLIAQEQGLAVDLEEYERQMGEARERARAVTKDVEIPTNIKEPIRATAVDIEYWSDHCYTRVVGYVLGDTFFDSGEVPPSVELALVTAESCFYAEQGGQIGDTGTVSKGSVELFRVTATRRYGDTVLHIGQVVDTDLELDVGDEVWLRIDDRTPITQNHTSTHMLNWALREVLGDHVQQKGSLVDPEKTRFDFSHNKPVSPEELNRIEDQVNERIEADQPVYAKEVDQKKAREINTLRAVFGEKYPDVVRVVSIGADIDEMLHDPKNDEWMNYPVEFCGGTHLKRTREAERFVLVSEEGVAKGIRRVVGITGDAAHRAEATGKTLLAEVDALAGEDEIPRRDREGTGLPKRDNDPSRGLQSARSNEKQTRNGPRRSARAEARGSNPARRPDSLQVRLTAFQQKVNEAIIPIRVRNELSARLAELQKEAKKQQKKAASDVGMKVLAKVRTILEASEKLAGVTIVVGEVPTAPVDALRSAVDWVRNKTDASAVLLATAADKKVTLIAGMSRGVVDKGVKAGELIKEIAPLVGGKGGGRPDMAQGGGNDPAGIPSAVERAKEWLSEKLS